MKRDETALKGVLRAIQDLDYVVWRDGAFVHDYTGLGWIWRMNGRPVPESVPSGGRLRRNAVDDLKHVVDRRIVLPGLDPPGLGVAIRFRRVSQMRSSSWMDEFTLRYPTEYRKVADDGLGEAMLYAWGDGAGKVEHWVLFEFSDGLREYLRDFEYHLRTYNNRPDADGAFTDLKAPDLDRVLENGGIALFSPGHPVVELKAEIAKVTKKRRAGGRVEAFWSNSCYSQG